MSSQHDFITYSHTASGLKHLWMWSHRRRLFSSVNTAFTVQSKIPTTLTSTDLHEHQTHACASSMTCALIWLVTGAALHQKRATSLKVLRLEIPRMLLCSLRPETYWMAGFICGWERCVCVQPEPRTTAALFYSPNPLTDWPIGHPGGGAGPASRVYKPGLDYEPCACSGVCSAVSH